MKKILPFIFISLFTATTYASIPYCPGTVVKKNLHNALQYVVQNFADENGCKIGNNCLLNFDHVHMKYSIAWAKPCPLSASKGNDPNGSTFMCSQGWCFPFGFSSPAAPY